MSSLRWLFVLCLIAGWNVLATQEMNAQDETPASLSGFESSQLYSVTDRTQLEPDDTVLTQLVYRTRSLSRESMDRFQKFSEAVSDNDLDSDPQKHRFWVFRRSATVTRIARQKLPESIATDELDEYWLLLANLDGQEYGIISRTVPVAWTKMKSLAEPIKLTGFFFGMKTLSPYIEKGKSVPVFVCNRIEWYPDSANEAVHLGESQIFLASQGVDLSYLDTVRSNQKRRMVPEESDYFYQMLSASMYAQKNGTSFEKAPAQFLDMIKEPNQHLAQVVEIVGNVRRIVKVPVTTPERRKELGVDHFYELDMYVPLADVASIRATDRDGNEIVYRDRFPVTVHVPSLPEPESEYRHNRLRVRGFFYRLWNYQSEFAKETNQSGQMSPLLIGFDPVIQRSSTVTLDRILAVAVGVFVVAALGLVVYLRWGDRQSTNPIRRKDDLPDQLEIPDA